MTPPAQRLLGPLLDVLLAARTQPAADHFDQAVSDAVAAGTLSADLARQLRYWQRAAVHEVCDHVRTVLPLVLPEALAAVATSDHEAAAAADAASDVWSGRHDEPAAPEPVPAEESEVAASTQAPSSAPDVIVLAAESDQPEDGRDSSQARRRLFVTGLTSTA